MPNVPTRAALEALGPLPIFAGVMCEDHNNGPLSPIRGEDAYWCLLGAHAIPFQVSESEAKMKASLETLRAWRRERARALLLPPYIIATDAVLRAVARAQPADFEALKAVRGLTPSKAAYLHNLGIYDAMRPGSATEAEETASHLDDLAETPPMEE